MKEFKKLDPNKKQIALMTIRVLYEEGNHEGDAVRILRKAHGIDLSQNTIRRFYSRFIREDIGRNAARDLLSEFSAG